MALKVYYESDADLDVLKGKKIAVIGYGSQGHAHALNLHESGMDVIVGLYAGSKSAEKARAEGLTVMNTAEAAAAADIIMILAPDESQKEIFDRDIRPNLKDGDTVMVAHGFNLLYGLIVPPADVDVGMIAPKSPGHLVRDQYRMGNGVPALVAVHQDSTGNAMRTALAYGKGIGSASAGIVETNIKDETETDNFGEQAVLCGGVSALVTTASRRWWRRATQPELAYFECLHELKLIVDLFYRGGLEHDALLGLQHGRVRRLLRRTACDHRGDPRGDAWAAARHPGWHVRQHLDSRKRGWRASTEGDAGEGRRAPDREGRSRASGDDAIHPKPEVARVPGSRPPAWNPEPEPSGR